MQWRALPAGKVATIVLAVLRCDQRPGDLAGGNGIHRTTVTRWVGEVVGLPVARAPRLGRALKKIARKGGGVVLLDGTLIRTWRRTGTQNRKNYSGKHKHHGLLVIALTDDKGRLLRVPAARPGRTSEITACRHDQLTARLRAADLGAIADLGFIPNQSAGDRRCAETAVGVLVTQYPVVEVEGRFQWFPGHVGPQAAHLAGSPGGAVCTTAPAPRHRPRVTIFRRTGNDLQAGRSTARQPHS